METSCATPVLVLSCKVWKLLKLMGSQSDDSNLNSWLHRMAYDLAKKQLAPALKVKPLGRPRLDAEQKQHSAQIAFLEGLRAAALREWAGGATYNWEADALTKHIDKAEALKVRIGSNIMQPPFSPASHAPNARRTSRHALLPRIYTHAEGGGRGGGAEAPGQGQGAARSSDRKLLMKGACVRLVLQLRCTTHWYLQCTTSPCLNASPSALCFTCRLQQRLPLLSPRSGDAHGPWRAPQSPAGQRR